VRNFFIIIAFASVLYLGYEAPALAQSAAELTKIEQKLSEQKASAAKLEEKEQTTGKELEDLQGKLVDATSSLQDKEAEQRKLESKLTTFEKEVALREAVLSRSRARLSGLVSALLQLIRRPPVLFLMLEDSEDDYVHRSILLRSMLPRLKDETTKMIAEIDSYTELQRETAAQKRVVTAAQQNLEWQRHNLDQMVKSRQGYLKRTNAEKEAMAKQLDALTNEAKDLRQLMEKVSNPSWGQTIGKGKSTENLKMKPGLRMPVSGDIVRAYGAKDEFGVSSQGLTIMGSAGSPVVAPQSGKVVFAGPFKGYGRIVILQHPKGYHSFLSGFGRIDAEVGQTVESGEPLGLLDGKKSEVYFEWRKGSEPVDPAMDGMKK